MLAPTSANTIHDFSLCRVRLRWTSCNNLKLNWQVWPALATCAFVKAALAFSSGWNSFFSSVSLSGPPQQDPKICPSDRTYMAGPGRLVCCSSQISSSWLSPAVVAQSPASRRDARATEEEAVGSEVPQATSSELMGGADLVAVMMLIASSRPETAVSILVCEKKSWVPYKWI